MSQDKITVSEAITDMTENGRCKELYPEKINQLKKILHEADELNQEILKGEKKITDYYACIANIKLKIDKLQDELNQNFNKQGELYTSIITEQLQRMKMRAV